VHREQASSPWTENWSKFLVESQAVDIETPMATVAMDAIPLSPDADPTAQVRRWEKRSRY
jgi:hypothetical protein